MTEEDRDVTVEFDRKQFVAQLRKLADVLEGGTAGAFNVDGEDILIPEAALFWVSHEREDGKLEIELQVTWSLLDDPDEEEAETEGEGDERD